MSTRKHLSKKIRFEVFKRDSFTCQYCGAPSPKVLLELDHIEPVSKGGTNEITNLVTSCHSCNRGKSDRTLKDDSVITKQKLQLDLLQERREQIELMLAWKKGLNNLQSETDDMIVSYIEDKIGGLRLTDNGRSTISSITKKFDLMKILEAIDLSAEKYLQYDTDGDPCSDSFEIFFNKINGILIYNEKPPVQRKISYIKGICRNRFNYFNEKTASIILNEYVGLLQDYGLNESQILNDLEDKVTKYTKTSANWSSWRNQIEFWTSEVASLIIEKQKEVDEVDEVDEVTISAFDLDYIAREIISKKYRIMPAIEYLGSAFSNFSNEEFIAKLDIVTLQYITELGNHYTLPEEERTPPPSSYRISVECGLLYLFESDDDDDDDDDELTVHLEFAVSAVIRTYFDCIDTIKDHTLTLHDFSYLINSIRSDSTTEKNG